MNISDISKKRRSAAVFAFSLFICIVAISFAACADIADTDTSATDETIIQTEDITAPEETTAAESEGLEEINFDLSPYEADYKSAWVAGDAHILEFNCDYSQYDESESLTNRIVIPHLTARTDAAEALSAQIEADFLSQYGRYLHYLAAGDTDKAPVQITSDYRNTNDGDIDTIVVRTCIIDFSTGQTTIRYACYYYNETEKTIASIADYIDEAQIYTDETRARLGHDTQMIAEQLNSAEVRLANSGVSGNIADALSGHTITADEIKYIFRFNYSGGFRAVVETGGEQYVIELRAGIDHGWNYYYIFDDTKSLTSEANNNLGAYVFARGTDKFEIECSGMIPNFFWISENKLALSVRLSETSGQISVFDMQKGLLIEYKLTADDICAEFGIDTDEYSKKESVFSVNSLSVANDALICNYYLTCEKLIPSVDTDLYQYQAISEIREGFLKADLTTGKLTFIEPQPVVIPTEFKEVTINPYEICNDGFKQFSENRTSIDNVTVTMTIPAEWLTNEGFLYFDNTQTPERGFMPYGSRLQGSHFLHRVDENFVWDSSVNIQVCDQAFGEYDPGYGSGSAKVYTSANGYTVVEYPDDIDSGGTVWSGIGDNILRERVIYDYTSEYYIKVSDEFVLFMRMYSYKTDPAEYDVIFRGVIDSLKIIIDEE